MLRVKILSRLGQFKDDQSGVIAILFALVLMPLLLVIGMSIDYGHATSYQTSMQRVLDETVIAGASSLAKTGDASKAEDVAKRRFEATKPTNYDIALSVSVNKSSGKVTAEAISHVPMSFMSLAGYKHLKVKANAVAASKRSASKRQVASNNAKPQAASAPQMSDEKVRDLIHRVNQMCYKLRQLNFADRVPQCKAVFDGSFEKKLRGRIASKGDTKGLLPSGVRLVQ